MNLSTIQWLSILLLDLLIKFVFVAAVGLLVTYGLISIASLVMAAISLSLLHFVCLFVGATLVVAPELFGVRLSRMLRFTASVAVANMLFVAALVVMMWPGPHDIPRTADGPISVALVLAATNLVAFFTVALGSRLIRRLKRRTRADQSAPGT
ncbi:hypothetical protein WHZ78_24105 [Bradyrhizobium symbiodeficiens]|uniref:hypothetical protein n=1 Tax=Bradyrhizobium symbiodeficiens TaxID=1404367 RepID=UPI0030CFC6F5